MSIMDNELTSGRALPKSFREQVEYFHVSLSELSLMSKPYCQQDERVEIEAAFPHWEIEHVKPSIIFLCQRPFNRI
jgi:hypothetical protein